MDALDCMYDMLSDMGDLISMPQRCNIELRRLREFMKGRYFRDLSVEEQEALIKIVQKTAQNVGKLINEFVGHASRMEKEYREEISDLEKEYREKISDLEKEYREKISDLEKEYREQISDLEKDYRENIENLIYGMMDVDLHYSNYEGFLGPSSARHFLEEMGPIMLSNKIENMLLEEADISNCIELNEGERVALLFKKAFPTFDNMQKDHERRTFLFEVFNELESLPFLICRACEKWPSALLLIGGLLSLKPMAHYIWARAKDDLDKITTDHMWQIFTYCYNDLPYFLRTCFLYFACYPIGYEIPTTSLTQIWIAEGFVKEEDKDSIEMTANKYLEELVQRSLVFVLKKSFLGKNDIAIKIQSYNL